MFVCTTVFGPILYYLWIYAGSANANFYFAIALAFSTAQVSVSFYFVTSWYRYLLVFVLLHPGIQAKHFVLHIV